MVSKTFRSFAFDANNAMFATRAALYFLNKTVTEGIPPKSLALTRGFLMGFTRLWDTDALGSSKSTLPTNGWARGDIVRSSQPVFVLTQLGPMYDVTKQPASWRPGL